MFPNWLNNHKQRATKNGSLSDWQKVLSEAPHRAILGLVMFNMFINYVDGEELQAFWNIGLKFKGGINQGTWL